MYNVVSISAVQHSDPVIHIHTFFFLIFSSLMFYPKRLDIVFLVLYSRTSLLIHSKCNSLHLPTPNPYPPHFFPPSPWQPQGWSSCLWVHCFVDGSSVPCFRFHIKVISCGIFLNFSDLLHLVWESLTASMLLKTSKFHSSFMAE